MHKEISTGDTYDAILQRFERNLMVSNLRYEINGFRFESGHWVFPEVSSLQ